jgi:hypothetical protein
MNTINAIGRKDRAMLRSNPSVRAGAWACAAAVLLPLLAPHALALDAINLSRHQRTSQVVSASTWLPAGKISAAGHQIS